MANIHNAKFKLQHLVTKSDREGKSPVTLSSFRSPISITSNWVWRNKADFFLTNLPFCYYIRMDISEVRLKHNLSIFWTAVTDIYVTETLGLM